MGVYINVHNLYGKPYKANFEKEGRYGIVMEQKWIVDVADTLDEARKKAVKWYKSAVENIHYKTPDPIYIKGTGYTTYGYVKPFKDNWVYVSKNIRHPFNPKTGKLIKE